MNEEIKQKIINKIVKEEIGLEEMAKKLYISKYQLLLLLKKWDVELPKKRKYRTVEMPKREELLDIYNEKGNAKEVAKHYDVGINTVIRWMKKLKIPTRKMVGMTDEEKKQYLEQHIDKINIDF